MFLHPCRLDIRQGLIIIDTFLIFSLSFEECLHCQKSTPDSGRDTTSAVPLRILRKIGVFWLKSSKDLPESKHLVNPLCPTHPAGPAGGPLGSLPMLSS